MPWLGPYDTHGSLLFFFFRIRFSFLIPSTITSVVRCEDLGDHRCHRMRRGDTQLSGTISILDPWQVHLYLSNPLLDYHPGGAECTIPSLPGP
ncbi:hypothetical protein K431DRAFT_100822 [Polychaeton citri CBS 116435]|uniref:Uncharacterized protein n=1 Tax=Polychaeton citri CBS 116435 TaxID=1314669 RepID=A0A9P4QIF1_9PEZI|nr:hypothetical protein K431DRAFT_100822 [Polychaeton citri CBS 116435]